MLTTFREIWDYIGSYKALINAINFFGYNSLQLYEYYKNVDQSSSLYGKLHKVLIPDIFDNTVEGWNEMDFIAGKYQQQNTWKKTNLFNYRNLCLISMQSFALPCSNSKINCLL